MQDCKPIKTPTAMNFKKELILAEALLSILKYGKCNCYYDGDSCSCFDVIDSL